MSKDSLIRRRATSESEDLRIASVCQPANAAAGVRSAVDAGKRLTTITLPSEIRIELDRYAAEGVAIRTCTAKPRRLGWRMVEQKMYIYAGEGLLSTLTLKSKVPWWRWVMLTKRCAAEIELHPPKEVIQ